MKSLFSRRIAELVGSLVRRRCQNLESRSGYVISSSFNYGVCPVEPEDHPGKNPSAIPKPILRCCPSRGDEVYASFEDILVVGSLFHLFVISPTRFPGRWKLLPPISGAFDYVGIARWKEQLLFLLPARHSSFLYSFENRSWIPCERPAHLFPEALLPPAWFGDSFYSTCRLLRAEEVEEMQDMLIRKTRKLDLGLDEQDEEYVPDLYSIMRFDAEERQWHQLEVSEGDVQLLSSGLAIPLVVQGRLLVFSTAWKYLQPSDTLMEQWYVRDEQADESWDGKSNPFKVFRLEENGDHPEWSTASESRRKNMKKLVDVTRKEFGKLVDTAWERKAAKFFTVDAEGDDVLLWMTMDDYLVERYHVSRNELLGKAARFFHVDTGEPLLGKDLLWRNRVLVHRDPGGDRDSVFSLFEHLPEINDSTPEEALQPVAGFEL